MNFNRPFWPRHAFVFKGGAAAPSAANIPAPPAPSASTSAPEVVQQQQDARKNAARKQGINSTILAGGLASNPFTGDKSSAGLTGSGGGKTTLLGGG